jgi:hypothetical protein
VLEPQSAAGRAFAAVNAALILLVAFVVMLEAAFGGLASGVFPNIDIFLEPWFLFAIFVNFHSAYIDASGRLIWDLAAIRRHYMQ